MPARPIRTTLLLACGAALAALPAQADTVSLKRSVRMPVDRTTLTLADVATLDGEAARALAHVVVFASADPTTLTRLEVPDVQAALEAAGANWGVLHLSGGAITIRPRPAESILGPTPMKPMAIEADHGSSRADLSIVDHFQADGLVLEHTIRGEIARRVAVAMSVAPADLRLRFDPGDLDFVASERHGAQLEIDPMSSLDTDRIVIAARLWADARVIEERSIVVHASVRTNVVELSRDIRAGDVVVEEALRERADWIRPSERRQVANRVEAVGRTAAASLRAGESLRSRDLQKDHVIQRGDRVTVRCLSGGVVITVQAEARADGALGDEIECRKVGERDTFVALVTAPGQAVIDLRRPSGAVEARPTEEGARIR
jgi:flagella basal body P-ring formation protein FlgA